MATPYPGNVTPLAQPAQDSAAGPLIRTIRLSDLHDALRLGWEDFKAVPSHAIILCVIYPVLGLVLARTVLGYSVLPLLFPLIVDRRFGIRTLRRFRLRSLSYGGQVAARNNVWQVALFWPRLPTTFYDARASHFMANRFFAGDPR